MRVMTMTQRMINLKRKELAVKQNALHTPWGGAVLAALLLVAMLIPSQGLAKLRVVTTLPDFAQLVEELGGERVESQALIQGTEDAHFVDPKPSHVVRLNQADMVVLIGLDLEIGWLPTLLRQCRNATLQPGSIGYFDASTAIVPKEVPLNIDRSMGDLHPGGNPHYYTSPLEMKRVAEALSARLMKMDPEGKAVYQSLLEAFRAKYARKMEEWSTAAAPLKGKNVVQYHKGWAYLLDWLGMKSVGALEPKPGIPPSASHVTKLLRLVQSQNVEFVLQTVYESKRLSKVFASKSGAKLLVMPSMVGSYPDVKTIWDKWDKMIAMLTESK